MSSLHPIDTADGTMALEVRGRGPVLLCVHGVSANRSSWSRVARRLETELTVFSPDLLGRGESEARPGLPYRLEDEVRRAAELLAAAAIETLIVAGHSHGAAIALGLARREPGVAALVLVNPVTPWTRRPLLLSARGFVSSRVTAGALSRFRKPLTRYILERRVLGPGFTAGPELVERYSAPYEGRRQTRALLAILADWHPEELDSWLPERAIPTLVLGGSRDRRMPVQETARLADLLGGEYLIAAGAGHIVPEERPDLVSEAIREVAAQVSLPPYERPDGGLAQA